MLQEDNTKRQCQWKTANIEELVTGRDSVVRGAIVRKSGKGKPEVLSRPLQRLIPVEISCRNNEKIEVDEVKECGEKGGLDREGAGKEGDPRCDHGCALEGLCLTHSSVSYFKIPLHTPSIKSIFTKEITYKLNIKYKIQEKLN